MQDRSHIEEWFTGLEKALKELNVKTENVWNFDETGFMVRYLQKGTFLWTYHEVEQPISTDIYDTVLVIVAEAISAAGRVIDLFIIPSGVVIPVKWVTNDLPKDITLMTILTGYTNNIVAFK